MICARENRKDAILAAFPQRLQNSREQEIATALAEIDKIARLRLNDAVWEDDDRCPQRCGTTPTARAHVRADEGRPQRRRVHELFEIDAAIQLEGDFDAAYRDGDNRNVIATDSMKNTVYVLAKEHAFDSVEQFALILARHFVDDVPAGVAGDGRADAVDLAAHRGRRQAARPRVHQRRRRSAATRRPSLDRGGRSPSSSAACATCSC